MSDIRWKWFVMGAAILFFLLCSGFHCELHLESKPSASATAEPKK